MDQFIDWFSAKGSLDIQAIGFKDTPDYGRGAFALKDIDVGFVLFAIPRGITLSTRTCSLSSKFGEAQWKSFGLHKGWAGLILCMLWEESLGSLSKWHSYLSTLPMTFNTPMFWNNEDLAELNGTSILEKIGKADAERDFHEKLVPAIKSRPDIFSSETLDKWYTVDRYHIMGSRILSRSFNVETETDENSVEGDEPSEPNTSLQSAMDVDDVEKPREQEDDSEEEEEDTSGITMVPMADLLNARYGCNNARLFDEDPTVLKMITTKAIKAGEQIWNTYGDLPNSDLLRRYGHVDIVPMPGGGEGNPADVVEIPASIVVSVMLGTDLATHLSQETCKERIDWWLEEAGDDTFVVETDLEIPHPLVVLIRLLLLPFGDWETAKNKQKPPKPKLDGTDSADVLRVTKLVLQRRLKEYPTTLEDDEKMLSQQGLSLNKRNALLVRTGEKRILQALSLKVTELENLSHPRSSKRKTEDSEGHSSKRSRR